MTQHDRRARLIRFTPWLAGALLVALALALRFASLGSRPVIHDESMFSFYAMVFARDGRYQHMPIMHRPTLMLLVGSAFRAFGDSIEVARAFIACCSLVCLSASLALVPRSMRWWFAPLLVACPILLYFSRFVRNEMLFCAVLMVGMMGLRFALSRPGRSAWWPVVGLIATIGLLAIKENALFVYAAGATFAVVWTGNHWLTRYTARTPSPHPRAERGPRGEASVGREPIAAALGWIGGLLLGLAVVALIYGLTLDPAYRERAIAAVMADNQVASTAAIDGRMLLPWHGEAQVLMHLMAKSWINLKDSWVYWAAQHAEQRISGGLLYHIPILLTYELPVLLLLLAGLIRDAATDRRRAYAYTGALAAWIAIWLMWRAIATPDAPGWLAPLQDFLHIAPNGSMLTLGLLIAPLLTWSILCLREDRVLPAWLGWWAACSMFQYASAGEKVPWLTVHIVLPLYMMLAWVWESRLAQVGRTGRRWAVAAVAIATLISLRNDVHLIGDRAADPRERLVYNHTTPWFDQLVRRQMAAWQADAHPVPLNLRRVVLAGAAGWPGVWYFRDTRYQLLPPDADLSKVEPGADLMIGDLGQSRTLMDGAHAGDWVVHQGSLRDHWMAPGPSETDGRVPTDSQGKRWIHTLPLNIARLWRYYWLRQTWTPSGGFPVVIFEPRRVAGK